MNNRYFGLMDPLFICRLRFVWKLWYVHFLHANGNIFVKKYNGLYIAL